MEQIIVTHPDGKKLPLFSKTNASGVSRADQTVELLGSDTLTLSVNSAVPLDFYIGDRIEVFGRAYTLNQPVEQKKRGGRRFEYNLLFEGAQYELIDAQWLLPDDTVLDTFTTDLGGFLQMLVDNANRVTPGAWRVGEFPQNTEFKTLTYSGRNCLEVLQDLCSQYGTEFEIQQKNGIRIIHLKTVGVTFPYTFRFGRTGGLYELQRKNVNSKNVVTRLYVYGGSNNLGNKYRYSKLCIPNRGKNASYIEEPGVKGIYGLKENIKTYEKIYPKRYGEVTAAGSKYFAFIDGTMDFDLNETEKDGKTTKWLIDGVNAKVKITTGNLAGYEFEIHKYDNATKEIQVVPFTDENGMKFPSETSEAFQFKKGDKYMFTDINLPDSYKQAAEIELQKQGTEDYKKLSQPQVQYSLLIDEAFLSQFAGKLTIANLFGVGDYIKVEDEDIAVNKAVRITAFTRDLLHPYKYSITLGDVVSQKVITRVISDIQKIDKIIEINDLADPSKARRNWRASQEVLANVFDPEGNYYTEKIKPLSIDTKLLAVGSRSQQFVLNNVRFEPNYEGNANTLKIHGGTLTHYTIAEDKIRSWQLADISFSALKPGTTYYIYAKCEKTGDVGAFLVDTEQRRVDSEAMNYYFLLGSLSSVIADADGKNGARLISLTYGASTISGRFVRTGRIESSGGGTAYFDLDKGEIGGRIVFTSDGSVKTLEELGQDNKANTDYIQNTLPGLFEDVSKQVDGKIETFYTEADPSLAWKTPEEKKKHVGDIWYNTKTKASKRFSNKFTWEPIEDADAKKALEDASKAQDTADGKRRVFVDTPYPPYDVGDLWAQGLTGEIMKCVKAKGEKDSYDAADWGKASRYTGDENLNDFIENTYNTAIGDIYRQLDGVIETWFGSGDPTIDAEWKTDKEKESHLGDLYYDNDTGVGWRYSKIDGGGYQWVQNRDSGVTEALAAAQAAQDTADGKRRVFVDTPYPPYDVGDLWASGTFLKRCIVAKASGYYAANDWGDATSYTGDENLNNFINGVFEEKISDIYNQIDGKLESFYGNIDPSEEWRTEAEASKHVGDIWYNTTNKTLWRWAFINDKVRWRWEPIEDAAAIAAAEAASKAQDTADGKRRVFVETPYPPYDVGDLWTDGIDLRICINPKDANGSFSMGDWILATDYTNDDSLNNFIDQVFTPDMTDIKNQLDGKIEMYYQPQNPWYRWPSGTEPHHVNDLWYNTTEKTLSRYRGTNNGNDWLLIEDAAAIAAAEAASKAQDTADGKRRVFVDTPYPPYDVGDLWLTGGKENGGQLCRCQYSRSTGSFYAGDWVEAVSYDNTKTTINGGIVTSGTVQLAGSDSNIKAGITGEGTADTSVRMWAGQAKEHKESAPFRVLQDGSFYASKGTITGEINADSGHIGNFNIDSKYWLTAKGDNYEMNISAACFALESKDEIIETTYYLSGDYSSYRTRQNSSFEVQSYETAYNQGRQRINTIVKNVINNPYDYPLRMRNISILLEASGSTPYTLERLDGYNRFGNYAIMAKAGKFAGLRPEIIVVNANTKLMPEDFTVIIVGNCTIDFPTDPEDGQMYFIFVLAKYNITFNFGPKKCFRTNSLTSKTQDHDSFVGLDVIVFSANRNEWEMISLDSNR